MINFHSISYAFLGGILPAILWLIFWLEEDKAHPEPDSRLLKAFLSGMAAVLIALPLERIGLFLFPNMDTNTFLVWAAMEELLKFLAAYIVALRSKDDNEPIDAMVYMITTALGFVAFENTLFILNPLLDSDIIGSITTGYMRFIGASLLHIVCSGLIGVALSVSYYESRNTAIGRVLVAFFIAVIFHTTFNLLIVSETSSSTLFTFTGVWASITALIFMFEKVKSMKAPLSTAK